jgi:hypothetical protein
MASKTKPKRKKVITRKKRISGKRINHLVALSQRNLLVGSVILSAVIIFIFAIFICMQQLFAANFADNFMRPALGNKTTISMEALLFKVEDEMNQIKYFIIRQNPNALTPHVAKVDKQVLLQDKKLNLQTITPFLRLPVLTGEGNWTPIINASGDALMAETFFRPDKSRPYAITYLVKMNMQHLSLGEVAGIVQPGGYYNSGSGKIPTAVQKTNNLVAAFNGGFQNKDGHYGMIVGNKTYLPLQKNIATLVIYKNSKIIIINYTGQDLGKDVVAVRQNCPILLQNSKDVSSSPAWNMETWGLTTTNSMYTWRSGIGVTKNGNLIYAAGPSLVPQSLAAALKAAGAVDAMQLDINPVWVRFILFNSLSNGQYQYSPLTKDMVNGGEQYLTGYQKDFFYLVER